jgi:hypothetical protein
MSLRLVPDPPWRGRYDLTAHLEERRDAHLASLHRRLAVVEANDGQLTVGDILDLARDAFVAGGRAMADGLCERDSERQVAMMAELERQEAMAAEFPTAKPLPWPMPVPFVEEHRELESEDYGKEGA